MGSPRVFLCYEHVDDSMIGRIVRRLSLLGLKPSEDIRDIPEGPQWHLSTIRILRDCDFVLACFSTKSVNKTGYFANALAEALKYAQEKPEGQTYLIPARLEPCELPAQFAKFRTVDLYLDESWDTLIGLIKSEMDRCGFVARTDSQGRLIFETTDSAEEPPAESQVRETNVKQDAGSDESNPDRPSKSSLLTKPLRVERLKQSLDELFEGIGSTRDHYLLELFDNLDVLVGSLRELRRDDPLRESRTKEMPKQRAWAQELSVRFISGLLKRVVNANALELRKLVEEEECELSFAPTSAANTGLILATNMEKLKKGDRYDVVSDLISWRRGQLKAFREVTGEAVKKGVIVSRVFNYMLEEPEDYPMTLDEKRNILEEAFHDANEWRGGEYKGRYQVRVFIEPNSKTISSDIMDTHEKTIREAHFGVFSRGRKNRTAVEYKVGAYNLSRMTLSIKVHEIEDNLFVFKTLWDKASIRSMDDISKIPELKPQEPI